MLWIYQLTTSNYCLTFIMFMGLAWGGRDGYISRSEFQANLKFMDTSYALEWKIVPNLLRFVLFSLLFFLNLFSGGATLFYMFSNNNMLSIVIWDFSLWFWKLLPCFKFQGACGQPTQPPSAWTTPNTSCKYLTSSSHQYFSKQLHHLILLSIFLIFYREFS